MHDDEGQVLILILAYTVIAALLVTVVVNLSRAYLHRRALVGAADGAAIAAANAPDLERLYTQGLSSGLPLSEARARKAVDQYVRDAQLRARFSQFRVLDVTTDGPTVSVTFVSRVSMPFTALLPEAYGAGYPVQATAHARSPISR